MTDNRHLPAVIQRWLQREHVKPRELVRRMGYRNEAKGLFESDPELSRPEHRLLSRKLNAFWQTETDLT